MPIMLPISSADRVDFTPDHYNGEDDAPIYRLKPLSTRDRSAVVRATSAEAGRLRTLTHRLAYIKANLAKVVKPPHDAINEVLDHAIAKDQGDWDDELRVTIDSIHNAFMEDDAEYRDMQLAEQHWISAFNMHLVARSLVDWFNVNDRRGDPIRLRMKSGGADVELVGYLPQQDLDAMLGKVTEMSDLSKAEVKNSEPPLGSQASQKTSKAGGKRQTAGKAGSAQSRKKSGRKIPA